MRQEYGHQRAAAPVSASEIAAFVYCKESWRLAELGLEPGNQSDLDAGTRHHGRKATAERIAGMAIGLGQKLVIVALLLLLILWLVWR
jgi:hypothetical protein